MRLVRFAPVLIAAALLAGCGEEAAGESGSTGQPQARPHDEARKVRAAVSVTAARGTARPGALLPVRVKNTGEVRLSFGYGFKLERKTGSGWKWVNRYVAIPDILYMLRPGDTHRGDRLLPEGVFIPKRAMPGIYRATKGFESREGSLSVSFRFRVVGRAE